MTKEKFILNAQTRKETGKAVEKLRQADKLPAVLYGHKIANQNLVLKQHEFEKALDKAGESSLIDLKIGQAEPVKIIIQDIQRHPVTHKIIHTDLYQVNMNEKITTDVELVFIGESPAVKDLSGSLVKALDSVEIECLPGDLISHLDVDLSTLKTFDDIIRVKDLSTSEKVEILTEPETTIALVEEPRKEEEIIEEKPEEEVLIKEGEKGKEGKEKVEDEKDEGKEDKDESK